MMRLIPLGLIVLCVVLAFTNPNQDAHKKVVCEAVAASKIKSRLVEKIAADVLGDANVLPLGYNNYYLFSTTTLNGQTASVGLFSHVWKLK